jgi:beta-lactamase class A
MNSVSADRHRATLAAFLADPRDHGSPQAMAKIVAAIWRGRLLTAPNLAFLQAELARNRRGAHRIRAGVPSGVAVADRTGTCDGLGDDEAACVNDVGVITLPSGEQVVLAVYVLDASGPVAAKERLIANVTRIVWEDCVARAGERRVK